MSEEFNPFRWLDEKISKQLSESERRQYLTFVKPVIDQLEIIKINTSQSAKTTAVKGISVSASNVLNLQEVKTSRKFILFWGLTTNQQDRRDPYDSVAGLGWSSLIAVRIGHKSADFFNLWPGTVFEMSKEGESFFVTTQRAFTGDTWQFFESDNIENLKPENIPFRIVETSLTGGNKEQSVMRASVNRNGDQFVVFRATPTVNVGTFPANQKVIITDGVSDLDIDASGRIAVNIAAQPIFIDERTGADFHQQQTAGAGAAVTMTITVTIGDLRMNFIDISMYSTAARTGGATPVSVTISGFEDNNSNAVTLNYPFPTAAAVGTVYHLHIDGAQLFRASTSAGPTNIVITCPGTASVIWRVNASYRDN